MESIDRLREWVNGLRGAWIDTKDNSIIFTTCEDMPPSIDSVNLRDHLNGILDAIEAEVADRYVALPLDADGVPIHVGDKVVADDGEVFAVVHLSLYDWGWRANGWCKDEDSGNFDHTISVVCEHLRHHYAPTVEDVLREFAERWDDPTHYAKGELVEEYAAKLRLAGEDA